MIITRAPFRVSFCGGGSDIPAFYEKHGGCVLSTSIRKYMYLNAHDNFFRDQIILKYSKTEIVNDPAKIEHRIFRQVLTDYGINGIGLTSIADIPSGTGLGSSSAFTVALLQLLHVYRGEEISRYDLAQEACDVEIRRLHEPIGKQDQFAAAFGGLNFYEFLPNCSVKVEPVELPEDRRRLLEKNLRLYYLGGEHSAPAILDEQSRNAASDADKAAAQMTMCDLARTLRDEFQKGNVDAAGDLLHENWMLKKSLASGITTSSIDAVYERARHGGATGGKLLGAGGAGFMLFYVPEEEHERMTREMEGIREVEFEMDNTGSQILFIDR